ncbi:MAG: hypothetical protein K6F00_03945 [Lachnospiraceae bacterium]|nr:hypothetical protein [Lachnospiraceae bacterium]
MQNSIARFMYGRCGFDSLARACYGLAILFLVINIFVHNSIVSLISMAFLGYSLFRILSRNITKRYAENQKFLAAMRKPKSALNYMGMKWRDRKTSRYYTCSKCHQHIRVPKGKGKIEITCPKCKDTFIKRT